MMTTTGADGASGEYGADTDDLGHFADATHRRLAELQELHDRLAGRRRSTLAALGEGPPDQSGRSLRRLIAETSQVGTLVARVRTDLLSLGSAGSEAGAGGGAGYGPVLARAVAEGRLDPPDDALRDRLLHDVMAGISPDDGGIDPAYYPAAVLDHHRLTARIAELEAERSGLDGIPLVWWDGDDEALARLDRRLDRLRTERDALAEHGFDHLGRLDRLDAAALVAETTGGSAWEGAIYASEVVAHHSGRIVDGPFGLGPEVLDHPDGFGNQFEHLAERVAVDREVAAAFFNGIGVERVADLPTFVLGSARDDRGDRWDDDWAATVLTGLARGLGAASRAPHPGVTGRRWTPLDFGGGELMLVERRQLQEEVVGYSPALLFTEGTYDDRFLADATLAALRLGARGDPRGFETHWGWVHIAGVGGGAMPLSGGEDPRNILLDRLAVRPVGVRHLFEDLSHGTGPGVDRQAAGRWHERFDALLAPEVPFAPMVEPPRTDRRWFEVIADLIPTELDLIEPGPAVFPTLEHPYPVTALLDTVAAEADLSRMTLLAVADTAAAGTSAGSSAGAADGAIIGDVGTAAGLDLVLAAHARTMVDPAALDAVGIDPSILNLGVDDPRARPRPGHPPAAGHGPPPRWATREVGPVEWQAVYGEVLRWGRGQALSTATDALLSRAIRGAVDERARFRLELTEPFAQLAGRAEAEAYGAMLSYGRELDDEARRQNDQTSKVVAVSATLVGLVPGLGLPATAFGLGWTWFYEGYPTTAEVQAHRWIWVEEYLGDDPGRWKREVAAASLAARVGDRGRGEIELEVPGAGIRTVPLREGDVPGRYEWFDPVRRVWSPVPPPDHNEAKLLFPHYESLLHRQVVSAADEIGENYRDGVHSTWSDRSRTEPVRPTWLEELIGPEGAAGLLEADAGLDAGWTSDWLGRP